jgi:hypothetical protein
VAQRGKTTAQRKKWQHGVKNDGSAWKHGGSAGKMTARRKKSDGSALRNDGTV